MTFSAALSSSLNSESIRHLIREDAQEDLCFALWHPSQGATRFSGLVHSLILPLDGEHAVHGNASFQSAYYERALGLAVEKRCGLAFLHSHPARGWQGMSRDDIETESTFAPPTFGATGLPLLGLTAGTDEAWSARFWTRMAPQTYEKQWCASVRVAGERLAVTYDDGQRPRPGFREELTRTVSAWGEDAQADLARLRVGVVGAGSVGSMVAEALARMGIGEIVLMDFDEVKRHNLDRLLHATAEDAERQRPKVEVLARGLRQSATASDFQVTPLEYSIVEEEGYRAALDCDVLFSCVDRPWARNVLNAIAYAHLIPVVDGGIHVAVSRAGTLRSADWRAHVAAPMRPCLECLGQYDPSGVSLESSGWIDDPTYIEGLAADSALKHNENVFAFSMSVASFQVLQFLSLLVLPKSLAPVGAQHYHFVQAELETETGGCRDGCLYPPLAALGDHAPASFVAKHPLAEAAREARRITATQTLSELSQHSLWEKGLSWVLRRFGRRPGSCGTPRGIP